MTWNSPEKSLGEGLRLRKLKFLWSTLVRMYLPLIGVQMLATLQKEQGLIQQGTAGMLETNQLLEDS
jgi:hypothetical protein